MYVQKLTLMTAPMRMTLISGPNTKMFYLLSLANSGLMKNGAITWITAGCVMCVNTPIILINIGILSRHGDRRQIGNIQLTQERYSYCQRISANLSFLVFNIPMKLDLSVQIMEI